MNDWMRKERMRKERMRKERLRKEREIRTPKMIFDHVEISSN